MKYFILKSAEGFDWIWSDEVELRGYSMDYEGLSIKKDWKELKIDYVDKGRRDFDICVATSPLFIFSKKAADLLHDILIEYGEFLHVNSPNDSYIAYHCTNVIPEALDMENTQIKWLDKEKGWISSILKYSFSQEKINDNLIFRIDSKYSYDTFFSEDFKLIIEKNNLKAFVFEAI